jgi:ferredoxin
MTFAVTEACAGGKDTACVAPCPMDCFLEEPDVPAIEPSERIKEPRENNLNTFGNHY